MLHVVGAWGVAEASTQMRDRSCVSRLLEQAQGAHSARTEPADLCSVIQPRKDCYVDQHSFLLRLNF